MDFRRIKQLIKYSRIHSVNIAETGEGLGKKGSFKVFVDIIKCYLKYHMWSNQYLKEKIYLLEGAERVQRCEQLAVGNFARDEWQKKLSADIKFFVKWSNLKYELLKNHDKRNKAYAKYFKTGKGLFVGAGVQIMSHHQHSGNLKICSHVGISRNCTIDYTGDLTIEDNVYLSQGVYINTHDHEASNIDYMTGHGKIKPLKLTICDGCWIGAYAKILPGCSKIGRKAIVGAGAVVRSSVPPYSIVIGNPAKVIGFTHTPDEIIELERNNYLESERLPIDILERNYDKYFRTKIKDISKFTHL